MSTGADFSARSPKVIVTLRGVLRTPDMPELGKMVSNRLLLRRGFGPNEELPAELYYIAADEVTITGID